MSDRERELQLKLEDKCKEVERLNVELAYSKQQLEDLRKKNCELEKRVDHLEDELTQLKSNMKKLEDTIKDKEVEKALLEKEKANMETDLWKAKAEALKIQAENEKMKREAVELEVGKLRRRLSKHSLDIDKKEMDEGNQTLQSQAKPLSSQKPVKHALSETSQNSPPHGGGPPSHIPNHVRPPGPSRRHSAASAADNSHRPQLRTSVCAPQLLLPSLPTSKSADSLQSQ